MKKRTMIFLLLAFCLILAACGRQVEAPVSTPAPMPVSTPEPTPEATPASVTEVVLGTESAEEILALAENSALEYVDGRNSGEYAAMLQLSELRPELRIDWIYSLCGREFANSSTEIAFAEGDSVDVSALLEGLQYLPKLQRVDLLAHNMQEADMAKLTERYPGIFFLWHVSFGRWTVPSDITCFSTLQPGGTSFRWTDEDLAPLFRYCTELRALDLGHNDIRDLKPIAALEHLQVLILVDSPHLVDASPLADMEQLEYLEFYLNSSVTDYSFLHGLTGIQDINLSYSPLSDLSFVDAMPNLKMAWIGFCPLSLEEVTSAREKHPEAEICNYYNGEISSTAAGWRASEENIAIRKAFTNWEAVESYLHWDEVSYRANAEVIETYPAYD